MKPRGAGMASTGLAAAFGVALASLLLGGTAGAAELGELKVSSYVGQPLVADIELVSLTSADMAQLEVHNASADVYRVASIGMDPALKTLAMSVMRRDQRMFLHLTTLKQVDASHLNLFLDLRSGDNSAVRAVTVWLEPEPKPVKAAVAAPAPASAPAPTPAPVPAPIPVPVPTLVPIPAVAAMPAPKAAPAAVPTPVLASALPAPQPSPPPIAVSAVKAAPRPADHVDAGAGKPDGAAPAKPVFERPAQDAPARLKPLSAPGVAASCVPHSSKDDASACAALDRKNAVIAKKLVVLEGKVKQLQDELSLSPSAVVPGYPSPSNPTPAHASAAAAAAATTETPRPAAAKQDAHAEAPQHDAGHAGEGASAAAKADAAKPEAARAPLPKPVPKHAPVPLKPKVKTAESADKAAASSGMKPTTLLALGTGALLLLIGAGVHLWRRRNKGDRSGAPSAPSKYWVLLRHPFRKKKPFTAPEPVTEVASDSASATATEAATEVQQ